MKQSKNEKETKWKEMRESYCEVCFVPFTKVVPKKLDEGSEICSCVQCGCLVHKSCYDLSMNSTLVAPDIREFLCQRCEKKDKLKNLSCIICQQQKGALKVMEDKNAIHIFCGLMHKEITVTSYYPDISFKKSPNYHNLEAHCGICKKNNATEVCIMDSCTKNYHGYCIWTNLKKKELEEDDPQCEKYYLSNGDNGKFDLSKEIMPKSWLDEEFDRVLQSFEEYGFKMHNKQKFKDEVYNEYVNEEEADNDSLKRGGFAYILCSEHESSVYCNCFNKGTGDMVQCECCFEWYHQKCVNFVAKKEAETYICTYCHGFYDLKKKIIEEVRSSKIEPYELKFESPKMHLNDYIWIMRVIDHRIAGGAATKMMKELAKYPLKTSKMELVMRNQSKKILFNLSESFLQKYLQSDEHQEMVKPLPVLGFDNEHKPIVLVENVEENRKIKKYVDFIQSFVKKNNIPDSLGPIIHELKFKEKAIEDSYDTILELSKSQSGYAEVPVLLVKVEEYSFMEIIKEINSGSVIEFDSLEDAVKKASKSSNAPSHLLKPLLERYDKVKSLVELIRNNINQNKEISNETEEAVIKLREMKIEAPETYKNFVEERKFIKELYIFYLKQEGKPLEESVETPDKIKTLLNEPACNPNREISECINQFHISPHPIHENIEEIVEKYSRICIIFELKDFLKKKIIKLSTLDNLYLKYEKLKAESNEEISNFMSLWGTTRLLWIKTRHEIEDSLPFLVDTAAISTAIKNVQEVIQALASLPIEIADKTEEIPELGSVHRLETMKNLLDALQTLSEEAQLKKNPLSLQKIPEGIPKENLLIKQYHSLKKENHELLSKFNAIYTRINDKISILKADPKKPRKDQMKENLEKPQLTEANNFIDTLKESKILMDVQIKELTKSVNKSLEIASKVNKFIAEEKHIQSIFKEEQADAIRKEIDELRRKVLIEAEICLENELKDLYQAEICIRMQKMILTSNAELDKMSKLLKFAEEEGLNHLPTYIRLKSKFETGHESTKELNLTKKHELFLSTEALKMKENDLFYSTLVFARKSLPLSLPQSLKQKNKHYEDLLVRNEYLSKKISFILGEEPKKYEIEEAKITYLECLKHPFEIQGLGKLINEFDKAEKLLNQWKMTKEMEDLSSDIFLKYDSLIFYIEEIEVVRKTIVECEDMIGKIKKSRQSDLSLDSLFGVEESLESIDQSTISKSSKLYMKFKMEYYHFWISLIDKLKKEKTQNVPYSKIKSILTDIYSTIQRNIRIGTSSDDLKGFVYYFEDLMVGVKNYLQDGPKDDTYGGFMDLEDIKYEILSGLDIKEEIKILNPFNDLGRFYNVDLHKSYSRNLEEPSLKRQRTDNFDMEDPYLKESKNDRSHRNIIASESKIEDDDNSEKNKEDWEKNDGSIVTEAQRNKAKEIIIKNIKKNPELLEVENIEEQVKMIENQLFGDNHNQVYKYFELVNSFEKLFIKLLSCPTVSAKLAKKKFEWNFLKLLISNIQKMNEIELMFIEKNKEATTDTNVKKEEKETKEIKEEQKKEETKVKERTIEEMIGSGDIDEAARREIKKEIKAIKDKNKKKKSKSSKSRRRSRSRSSNSRSPDAKFSSDSEENKLPIFIEKEYIESDKSYFNKDMYNANNTNTNALLYDPEMDDKQEFETNKKNYPNGTVFQIKSLTLELNFKKKGKVLAQGFMMTDEDYTKISQDIVDPNLSLQLKRDKTDMEIIQYLNKPTRNKYKFLVGWFESDSKENNESIKEFAMECNEKKKIFGVQNDHIKMHIMSVHQYVKIKNLYETPHQVANECAKEILKKDRLIYIIQYPSEKMYEMKGLYKYFTDIQPKEETYEVDVPEPAPIQPQERMPYTPNMYSSLNSMAFNPMAPPPEPKMPENNFLKPAEYEGWGNETSSSSFSAPAPIIIPQSFNQMNFLSRFSPIMTDEEDGNEEPKDEKPIEKEIDLASNILNSLADVPIKTSEMQPLGNRYPIEQPYMEEQNRFDHYNRYPMPMQAQNRWQPQMMPQQVQMPRMNIPYNPMSIPQKYPPPPPNPMMYKNPMMPMGHYFPPPNNQPSQQNIQYDPYGYQRK